jgi:hypothetical protein
VVASNYVIRVLKFKSCTNRKPTWNDDRLEKDVRISYFWIRCVKLACVSESIFLETVNTLKIMAYIWVNRIAIIDGCPLIGVRT